MPSPERVVFVVEYYYPHVGGGEIVFQHLAEGLAARGLDVHVVTCRLPDTAREETLRGVRIHRVVVPRAGRRHWFSLLALPRVLRLTDRATVVHTTTHNGAFPAWIGARLRGARCVMTVHEVFGPNWARLAGLGPLAARAFRAFESVAVRLPFDWQVCVSEYTRRKLEEYYPMPGRRSSVIYNGVDTALFDPERVDGAALRQRLGIEDRFVALYFGRPGYSKGLDYLIDAVPRMVDEIPSFLLLLLLADEPRDLYDAAVRRLRPHVEGGQVRILPPVAREALPAYLAAADCVVIPSLSEGFGLSAAEACAMGRPVVATTGGALPEVVSGRCILVPPRDASAIAEAAARASRGDVPILPARPFSWKAMVECHLNIYCGHWRKLPCHS